MKARTRSVALMFPKLLQFIAAKKPWVLLVADIHDVAVLIDWARRAKLDVSADQILAHARVSSHISRGEAFLVDIDAWNARSPAPPFMLTPDGTPYSAARA